MTSLMRIILVTSALILPLGGCASIGDAIDPTEWFSGDMFSGKKKLPGDRKPVFPEGVPGVTQGIPSDLVKGNQQPPLESGYAVTDTQSVNSTPRPANAHFLRHISAVRPEAALPDWVAALDPSRATVYASLGTVFNKTPGGAPAGSWTPSTARRSRSVPRYTTCWPTRRTTRTLGGCRPRWPRCPGRTSW